MKRGKKKTERKKEEDIFKDFREGKREEEA
jgi:hypothetical protein